MLDSKYKINYEIQLKLQKNSIRFAAHSTQKIQNSKINEPMLAQNKRLSAKKRL